MRVKVSLQGGAHQRRPEATHQGIGVLKLRKPSSPLPPCILSHIYYVYVYIYICICICMSICLYVYKYTFYFPISSYSCRYTPQASSGYFEPAEETKDFVNPLFSRPLEIYLHGASMSTNLLVQKFEIQLQHEIPQIHDKVTSGMPYGNSIVASPSFAHVSYQSLGKGLQALVDSRPYLESQVAQKNGPLYSKAAHR